MTVWQENGPKMFYIGLTVNKGSEMVRLSKGLFFNYVDKTRKVGGTGNVKGMKIFLTTVKKLIHNLRIWVNVVKEWPLI